MRQPCSHDLTIWHRSRGDAARRFEVSGLLDATPAPLLRPSGLLDVSRAAELYIGRDAAAAELEVAQQIRRLRAAGDHEGAEVWVCIYDTISQIRRRFWSEMQDPLA